MNFGLDYDGTVTSTPELWQDWLMNAQRQGHKVYLVTMRYPSELTSVDPWIIAMCDGVFATSRMAKRPFMQNQKIDIHVWIDDHPEAVVLDAIEIWPVPSPEGVPVVPEYE